jgi:hypothetical protein
MMNFFLNFFDLIKDASDRDISVGLNFDWNLLVMNVMLRLVDLNNHWLLYDFWHLNRVHPVMVFVDDLVHIQENFLGNFDCVLNLDDLFAQKLNFAWHFDVLDGLRAWDLTHNLNLDCLFDPDLHDFGDGHCVGNRDLLFDHLRHFYDHLHCLLSCHWLLHDELHWYFVLERHHHFSIFHCHFVDLNDLLYDPVPVNFDWNFSDHLCRNSSLNLHFFWHLLLHNQLHWLFSLYDFDFFNVFDDWPFNDDLLDDFDFSDDWEVSEDFDDLEARNFDSDDSFDDFGDFDDFFDNSWNWDNLLDNSLNFNNSRHFNNLLNDPINKDGLNPDDFLFNNDWHRHFNPDFLNDLLSDGDNFGSFLVDDFDFGLDVRSVHFDVDWFLFFVVKWDDFLYFKVFGNEEFLTIGFFNDDFDFFDDLLTVTLDEVGHFDEYFFFDLADDLFFLDNWHFNDSLLGDFVWHWLFNDFMQVNLPLFSVSNKPRHLPVQVDSFAVSNHVRHLTLNFNVTVALEYLFVDDLDLFHLLSGFADVHWLLDHFLDLDVLLFSRHLHQFLHFDNFRPLHHNFSRIVHLDHLLFIQRHDFLDLDVIQSLIHQHFLCNHFSNRRHFNNPLVLELHFHVFDCWVVDYAVNVHWYLLDHFNCFLCVGLSDYWLLCPHCDPLLQCAVYVHRFFYNSLDLNDLGQWPVQRQNLLHVNAFNCMGLHQLQQTCIQRNFSVVFCSDHFQLF